MADIVGMFPKADEAPAPLEMVPESSMVLVDESVKGSADQDLSSLLPSSGPYGGILLRGV